MSFKPMLAKDYDPAKLVFPVYASPKLDGIRASVLGGKLLSRTLKPIPNKFVSGLLSQSFYEGLDGELIVGETTAKNVFSNTTSHVMSHDKADFEFKYHVFDYHNDDRGFDVRYQRLLKNINPKHEIIVPLKQTLIKNMDELDEYEATQIEQEYEGVILRKVDGLYKFGRSTVNEGLLLKVKRFMDAEAVIIGFEEQMENTNEKTTNELGRSKRSSHKDGKVGKNTLGALIVRDLETNVEFNIGTGMDDALRAKIWANRPEYMAYYVKYKYFPVGVKDKPRHPVFLGFRDVGDM